jgi:hypothetical protein
MLHVIGEQLLTLLVGILYLLGARYLLELGDIDSDMSAIERFLRRHYRKFSNILYWYQPRELFHQLRGLRIVNSACKP